jgi:2-amino-4-hydroxy-6-hydroxymethyldihydropteridine diphosphokinase
MARVFIGIGTNMQRETNLRAGIAALREEFGSLMLSPVYESIAVGFEGENFLNLVAAFNTELDPAGVARILRGIESRLGREHTADRFAPRTLDLDLLLYDDVVLSDGDVDIPREDIKRYAFVLRPLADIAGDQRHPATGERFADLWSQFDRGGQALWRVEVEFEGTVP